MIRRGDRTRRTWLDAVRLDIRRVHDPSVRVRADVRDWRRRDSVVRIACRAHARESGPSGMALEDIAWLPRDSGFGSAAAVRRQSGRNWSDDGGRGRLRVPARTHRSGSRSSTRFGELSYRREPRAAVFRSWCDPTIVASGVTVHPRCRRPRCSTGRGIAARVIDCYPRSSPSTRTHCTAAADTDLLVTAEDHYIEGGLGSAVAEVLAEAGVGPPLCRLA